MPLDLFGLAIEISGERIDEFNNAGQFSGESWVAIGLLVWSGRGDGKFDFLGDRREE